MSGGPKYVKDFEFPSSFGFTGSAHDRPTVPVRGYERRRFQEGGRVQKEPKKEEPKTPPKEEPKESFVDILKGDERRRREKELGLKKGGKVKKYAKGGDVAQDRKMIDKALKKHVNTPAPKGHKGLKGC